MAIQIQGLDSTGNNILNVDLNNNIFVAPGLPVWPASGGTSGGYYTTAGQTIVATAASLGTGVVLASMTHSSSSTRSAYITKMRMMINVVTPGTAALIPGTLVLQRFTGGTPSGGWVRFPNRLSEISGNTSNMTDIRDSDAGLTVTNCTGTSIVASSIVPIFAIGGLAAYEWIVEPSQPIVLVPGEGIWIRCQVAMPATQTWTYSYTFHWRES